MDERWQAERRRIDPGEQILLEMALGDVLAELAIRETSPRVMAAQRDLVRTAARDDGASR